jgi:hypothetical protein
MKKTLLLLSIPLGFLLTGCSASRLLVDNDYSYDTDFTVYRTYNFLNCEIDTSDICTEIHDAVRRQMKARGYKVSEENPDLLVSHSIIKERVGYKGYFQPSMDRWVNRYETNEVYKVQNLHFNGGMILVSLLDAESSRLIWRGYAAGVFNRPQSSKGINYYRGVVRSIFDQYPLFAAGEKPRRITEEML